MSDTKENLKKSIIQKMDRLYKKILTNTVSIKPTVNKPYNIIEKMKSKRNLLKNKLNNNTILIKSLKESNTILNNILLEKEPTIEIESLINKYNKIINIISKKNKELKNEELKNNKLII